MFVDCFQEVVGVLFFEHFAYLFKQSFSFEIRSESLESCSFRFHNKVDFRPIANQNFDGTFNLSVNIGRQKFFMYWVWECKLDVCEEQDETILFIKLKRLKFSNI